MHAYLIVGGGPQEKLATTGRLAKNLHAKILEFPLQKIEDTRSLAEFTRLAVGEPTAILINGIDTATTEALNAFLKNLEEPQENLYYLLTASSVYGTLPTVISRCQVVKIVNSQSPTSSEATKRFMQKSAGEKLAFVDQIKKREEAIQFLEEFILSGHKMLVSGGHKEISHALETANSSLNALKANGNVALQLANFVIQLNEPAS